MGSVCFFIDAKSLLKKMVLALKVNVGSGDSETLNLESDVTWNGFVDVLVQEFSVPVDLLKFYSISDIDREHNLRNYVTGANKDKKLIEIAGVQPDGHYEFDMELPAANVRDPIKIKAVSERCSVILDDHEVFDLKNPGSEYKIQLPTTGFRRNRGRKLKLIISSSDEKFQYRKYVVEDLPNSQIEIDMKDKENPTVTLVQNGCGTATVIDYEKDDVLLRTEVESLSGKQVLETVGIGALNVFTFLTNLA